MKKLICGLIVFCILAVSLFAGGEGQQGGGSGAAGPVKLSYYEALGRAATVHKSLATHPSWVEVQKRLNMEIEFRAPAVGNEGEQFNLMMASRDFPDIITYGWLGVSGGPARYIQDDVIIKLNDVIDKWAPDTKKAFAKFPVAKREATLDDGTLYCFPQIYSNDALAFFHGPLVRYDILEKVPGVDVSKFPENMETLDEWEKVLVAVKNSGLKGDSGRDIIPLSFIWADQSSGFIVGAFGGITTRFTQENGNPIYGPADPRYQEYIAFMKRWYDMGLIDPEFAANNKRMMDEKVLDNRVFSMTGAMGAYVTDYTRLARPNNPAFLLKGTSGN